MLKCVHVDLPAQLYNHSPLAAQERGHLACTICEPRAERRAPRLHAELTVHAKSWLLETSRLLPSTDRDLSAAHRPPWPLLAVVPQLSTITESHVLTAF